MRKLTMVSLAGAAAGFAVATPASAQYYQVRPMPQQYSYGYSNNSRTAVLGMKARIDGIQQRIGYLYSRRAITRDEYNGLRRESNRIEARIARYARYGINPAEAQDVDRRIYKLEAHIAHEVNDGNYWKNRNRPRWR